MKVALNATALLSPLTGIGQYTYHLAKGLQALPELELDLFYGSGWSKEVRDQTRSQHCSHQVSGQAVYAQCLFSQPVFTAKQVHSWRSIQSGRHLSRAKFSGVQIQWTFRNHRTRFVLDSFPPHPPGGARACHEYLF